MAEQRLLAEQDYIAGMKYKELAEKYGVSINTVKSWKQRYGWQRKKGAYKIKSMHTKNDGSQPNREPIILVHNELLTDRQILFVAYYLKDLNATRAYKKAYNCDYETAKTNGNRLLTNAHIKEEVIRVRDKIFSDYLLTPKVIMQKYMDIAFADIGDYLEFGSKDEQLFDDESNALIDPAAGENMTYKRNYVAFNSSSDIDGTIISEVKQGKDGVSIKLSDRIKALEKLEKYTGMMSDEEKARVELLKSKVPNKDGIDPYAQITALANLINNPAPEWRSDND